jgi:hypothetical protein
VRSPAEGRTRDDRGHRPRLSRAARQPHGRRGQWTAGVPRQAHGTPRDRAPRAPGGASIPSTPIATSRPMPRSGYASSRTRSPGSRAPRRLARRVPDSSPRVSSSQTVPCDSPSCRPPGLEAAHGTRERRRSSPWRRPATSPIPSSASCAARAPVPREFLRCGQRKIDRWYARSGRRGGFDDEAQAFMNINTRDPSSATGVAIETLTITQASCANDIRPEFHAGGEGARLHPSVPGPVSGTARCPVRDALGRVHRRGHPLARGRALATETRHGRLGDAAEPT